MQLLDTAIQLMRRRHKKGELYYWVLYYTYLSPPYLLHPPGGRYPNVEQRSVGVYLARVCGGAEKAGAVSLKNPV